MTSTTTARAMHDYPALAEPTLCAAFQRTASENPDRIALRTAGGGIAMTWAQYRERVGSIAAGLAACGVTRGDTVGLLLANRPEFHLLDTATMHLGATPFSIYNTNPADEVAHLIRDAGCRIVATELAFLPRVLQARESCADLEHVVVVDGEGGTITLAELEARGDPDFDLEGCWKRTDGQTVVTLIYTSGTTGDPKGVEHTNATVLFGLRALHTLAPVTPGGSVVSYLPMAHIAERFISQYSSMVFGYTITCCPDFRELAATLPDARPTRFFGVPRVFEKMHAALAGPFEADPHLRAALEIGLRSVRAGQADEVLPAEEAQAWRTAKDSVLPAIRSRIGFDRAEWVGVAAAPTPYHVLEFFHAIDVRIAELWGMSECILVTSNPPGRIKLGTVGVALPGLEIRLAGDGEILVRGGSVMPGYRNLPERTAEAIDSEGWLHSGDIATKDGDGYLTIVDRKKEMIINSAGKNMSPAKIEGRLLEACSVVGQAVCLGDRRPYNVALLVLDPERAASFARQRGLEPLSTQALAASPELREAVARGVAGANQRLARVEQIKRFHLLGDEWLPGGDELTPTSKLKRRVIDAKYAAEIEGLYGSDPGAAGTTREAGTQ
jgi:long-chain acyl-CoA synthetase